MLQAPAGVLSIMHGQINNRPSAKLCVKADMVFGKRRGWAGICPRLLVSTGPARSRTCSFFYTQIDIWPKTVFG